MTVEELLTELRKLDREDKLRAAQVLVIELAADQPAVLQPGGEYEVWSPYDAAEAAETLNRLLEADAQGRAPADA